MVSSPSSYNNFYPMPQPTRYPLPAAQPTLYQPATVQQANPANLKPLNKTEERPLSVKIFKSMATMVAGVLGGILGGHIAGKALMNKLGAKAIMLGNFLGFAAFGALAGGIFSAIYQKSKTNAINKQTLVKDTLWGMVGF